jgi:hypothetical protein
MGAYVSGMWTFSKICDREPNLGDIRRGLKISFMEKTCDENDMNQAKSFRKMMKMREKAVLKERAKKEINRQLDD